MQTVGGTRGAFHGMGKALEYNECGRTANCRMSAMCPTCWIQNRWAPDNDAAIHPKRARNDDAWLVISAGALVGNGYPYPFLLPAAAGRVHGLRKHDANA